MTTKTIFTNPWDERYSCAEFHYGKAPNEFLRANLEEGKGKKALFPAEGEGRNAVYSATLGWQITAFDLSMEGRKKALQYSEENEVSIDYLIDSFDSFDAEPEIYDLIVLIFAHMTNREKAHKKLISFLKPGGVLLLEGFAKDQINYNTGGPKIPELLFSREEILNDFNALTELNIEEKIVYLSEGEHHKGKASVIRVIGRK